MIALLDPTACKCGDITMNTFQYCDRGLFMPSLLMYLHISLPPSISSMERDQRPLGLGMHESNSSWLRHPDAGACAN